MRLQKSVLSNEFVQGHPRVGIVLTDGVSDYSSLTLAAAQRMHEANIIAFAIGVGTSLDITELTAIASTPTCTYLVLLSSGFNELDSLVYVIEKMACEGMKMFKATFSKTYLCA